MVAVPSQEPADEVNVSFFIDPNSDLYKKLPENWSIGGLSQANGIID